MNVEDLRTEYRRDGLERAEVEADPMRQFRLWFEEALASRPAEPTAMTLATATRDGRPSARTVLLKSFGDDGFVFYTNYESRKGRELAENPRAALLFFWPRLERQVRVEGVVERLSREASEAYFRGRPPGSRLGAWASPQSRRIPSRRSLEERFEEARRRFGDDPPLPPFWGGFRLVPEAVELWQGRPNRLHDRLLYRRREEGWTVERLAP